MSAVVRAIGPFVDSAGQSGGVGPPDGTRPSDGLNPLMPHIAAGMRMEPPPSEPVPSGIIPVASAAAVPPDDPPALRSRSKGLRVGLNRWLTVSGFHPSSGVFVLPT